MPASKVSSAPVKTSLQNSKTKKTTNSSSSLSNSTNSKSRSTTAKSSVKQRVPQPIQPKPSLPLLAPAPPIHNFKTIPIPPPIPSSLSPSDSTVPTISSFDKRNTPMKGKGKAKPTTTKSRAKPKSTRSNSTSTTANGVTNTTTTQVGNASTKSKGKNDVKEEMYCICRKPYKGDNVMVACDGCEGIFRKKPRILFYFSFFFSFLILFL